MLFNNWFHGCSEWFPWISINLDSSIAIIHILKPSIFGWSDILFFHDRGQWMDRSCFHHVITHVSLIHVSQDQCRFPSTSVKVSHSTFFKVVIRCADRVCLTHLSAQCSGTSSLWVSPFKLVLWSGQMMVKVLHLRN